ncbi:hypothetical protein O6H91_06G069100 [Diphasiastrum complanatum]|uniref:Uncharacterized protein n=1 Tax=Diphasiastrum complanatum TaxID=34168 RepID=A0ACC2DES0_DIPCM|nr:hypothetical protein O6H91_06G069100 [Diphasiastrum complanatum]
MPSPANTLYDECDHPRMGISRRCSQKNPLLVKPRLGAGKRVTQLIPDDEYIYGICNDLGAEGVREVLVPKDSVLVAIEKRGPDMVAMNKLAAQMRFWRASEQRKFRKDHYIPSHISKRLGQKPTLPSNHNAEYVYGRIVERPEQVGKILQNAYANEWIDMHQFHHHEFQMERPRYIPPKTNKSTELYAQACYERMHRESPKDRFIMSKFKNVHHKIDNMQKLPLKRDTNNKASDIKSMDSCSPP